MNVISKSTLIKEGFDIQLLNKSIKKLLGSNHPLLSTISNYYFNAKTGGKNLRPSLVLLMSKATAGNSNLNWIKKDSLLRDDKSSNLAHDDKRLFYLQNTVDERLGNGRLVGSYWDSVHDIDDENKNLTSSAAYTSSEKTIPANRDHTQNALSTLFSMDSYSKSGILPTQQRLAEITEMIHTASLLHDDVIDSALQRRGMDSVNKEYGNKMAILAGDFLLARASLALARLRNVEVVELLSTVIANLVEGEFMQLRNSSGSYPSQFPQSYTPSTIEQDARFTYYLQKTYLKTASLIAKSCHASTLLSNCSPVIQQAAFNYGRNLGIAFQLVDDMLDFTTTSTLFGKPVNADLSLGLATAPVLYASEKHPSLHELISRNFEKQGDVQVASDFVRNSDGIDQTRKLAAMFCREAVQSLAVLEDSEAKQGLVDWAEKVLSRTK